MVYLMQNVHDLQQDTIYLDEVLKQLLLLRDRKPEHIEIVVCLSTSTISGFLRRNLAGKITGDQPPYSMIIRVNPRRNSPKRLELVKELDPNYSSFIVVGNIVRVFAHIRQRYEYKRIALCTWDHGSGYAIFTRPDKIRGRPLLEDKVMKTKLKGVVVVHPDHFAPVHRLFRAAPLIRQHKSLKGMTELKKFKHLLQDIRWMKPPRSLTMDNLRMAIRRTFGKVDIIFMRNCFMQMFDTGFVLKDVTRWLVACEGAMWFRYYDYDILLDALQAMNGRVSMERVAGAAVTGFSKLNNPARVNTDTALFGNDLYYYPELNKCMNAMILILLRYAKYDKQTVLHCRKQMTDIGEKDFPGGGLELVDARLWFEKAGALIRHDTAYHSQLKRFQDLHEKAIGKRNYRGQMAGHKWGASGFSLYFPSLLANIAEYRSFYQLYYALKAHSRANFTRHSHWDEFISYLLLPELESPHQV